MNQTIEFYDIYDDFVYTPLWQTKSFQITMAIFIAILIIASITLAIYLKKKKQRQIIPAWEKALQELKKLNPQNFSSKKDFKIFYFTLTTIAKNYLYDRYTLRTAEKTDAELIAYLTAQKFNQNLTGKLEQVLQGAQLIKFADAQTMVEQANKDLLILREFIEKTIPQDLVQHNA